MVSPPDDPWNPDTEPDSTPGPGTAPDAGAPSPSAVEIWLRNEHLSPEERLDRLAGDADLERALRARGFDGEDWDFVVEMFAEYGIAVIGGWLRRGLMVARCAEKNVKAPALPDHVRCDEEAVYDIATETVAESIVTFRDHVLVPGRWDPAKGASLRTFFIGQCILRYPNIARRFLTQYQNRAPLLTEQQTLHAALDTGAISGVEDDAIRTVTVQNILKGVTNPKAARALAMDACGYSNTEIATDLGISRDAASSLLKRARQAIRDNQPPQTGTSTA